MIARGFRMKRFATPFLFVTLLLPALALAAPPGDIAAGQEKSKVCAACHGADGNAPDPQYPRLAGQWQNYLFQALTEYKTGQRDDPIMKGFVSSLSEQDMHDLAAYYASLPGKLDDLHGHIQGD